MLLSLEFVGQNVGGCGSRRKDNENGSTTFFMEERPSIVFLFRRQKAFSVLLLSFFCEMLVNMLTVASRIFLIL